MIETKFKETELGPIPEDWKIGVYADFLSKFSAGSTPYRGNLSNFVGDIPWLSSGELNYCLIEDSIEHISEEAKKTSHLTLHPAGTFLMAITGLEAPGTRGRCAILKNPCTTNQSCLAIYPTESMITDYLYWFYRQWSELFGLQHSQGSKQQSFTARMVEKLPIYAPSIEEQKEISSTLYAIDAYIHELEKLISKKRDVLQGSRQQLLSAKTRLKGYSKKWIDIQIGNIGKTYTGLSGKTKSNFGHGEGKYITFLNVLNNSEIDISKLEQVEISIDEKQNQVKVGDLFFNTSSETPEEVGMCSTLSIESPNTFLNSFCFGFRITHPGVDSLFLTYLFRSDIGRRLMSYLAKGVTRYNLSKSEFKSSLLRIPSSIEEQKEISEILSSMEMEIAELEAKLEKYKAVRDGMMQQLLTGKIRLI